MLLTTLIAAAEAGEEESSKTLFYVMGGVLAAFVLIQARPDAITELRRSPVADLIRSRRLIAILRRVEPQARLLELVGFERRLAGTPSRRVVLRSAEGVAVNTLFEREGRAGHLRWRHDRVLFVLLALGVRDLHRAAVGAFDLIKLYDITGHTECQLHLGVRCQDRRVFRGFDFVY